jgi:hypothetical protein
VIGGKHPNSKEPELLGVGVTWSEEVMGVIGVLWRECIAPRGGIVG